MTTAFIALGKHGDICSILPILYGYHLRTGAKPTLVTSAEFSAIPSRAAYVETVLYPGHAADLAGAIRWAKERFDFVVPASTYGTNFPIQHRHPSFQYDQWDRAGALAQWDTLPLVLDRPKNAPKLAQTHLGDRPSILVGDRSESSPFGEIDALVTDLEASFGSTHRIVRLSGIKLPSVADLLALYDKAACLVSVETIHLHLAKASQVPIVAIVTDSPSRWHGSAWSNRFEIHVRYADYQSRKSQVIEAVRGAIDVTKTPILEPL